MCSADMDGMSTSWKWTSSNASIPGSGNWVMNGPGPAWALEPVSFA